ncbi:MAG: isochorismatase family protein [Rhodomicrobium sp.]
MRTIGAETASLLIVDLQPRLMRVIEDAEAVIANAKRLSDAAALFGVPVLFTEQNPKALGSTVETLAPPAGAVLSKLDFDACRAEGLLAKLGDRPDVIAAGCEAHVCVLQTVLSLLDKGRRVFVVRDAIGSRRAESKETAIRRMERHGAEIVTAEMVIFEWLGTAAHPRFKEAAALVK